MVVTVSRDLVELVVVVGHWTREWRELIRLNKTAVRTDVPMTVTIAVGSSIRKATMIVIMILIV